MFQSAKTRKPNQASSLILGPKF